MEILVVAALAHGASARAADQVVTLVPSMASQGPAIWRVLYSSANPRSPSLTGIGLRIHFDSRGVLATLSNTFGTGLIGVGGPYSDSQDFDLDSDTDSYFVVAWADVNSLWPGVAAAALADLRLTATGTGGTGHVGVSVTSTAAGCGYKSGPYWGDANLDGAVDVFDLVILSNFVVGNVVAGTEPFLGPIPGQDSKNDGLVDVFDLVTLAAFIAGNVSQLPLF